MKKYYFVDKKNVFKTGEQFDYDKIEIINLDNKSDEEVEKLISNLNNEVFVEENSNNLVLAIYHIKEYDDNFFN